MTIQVGDKVPEANFKVMTAEGPQDLSSDDVFGGMPVPVVCQLRLACGQLEVQNPLVQCHQKEAHAEFGRRRVLQWH